MMIIFHGDFFFKAHAAASWAVCSLYTSNDKHVVYRVDLSRAKYFEICRIVALDVLANEINNK